MKMDDMIKEIRELRDDEMKAKCTDDHCLCERYDRIIDALLDMKLEIHREQFANQLEGDEQ